MDEETKAAEIEVEVSNKFHPTSVRLDAEHAEILEDILAAYAPPGVRLSFSDGVKIALVFWKENFKGV